MLLIEDCEEDAELNLRALRRAGYSVDALRVESAAAMRDELTTQPWDVILCDYSLPTFDALAALRIVSELGIDIPFIVVSGTVAEETAIEAMRVGAHDYMLKENLRRLGAAVERELRSFAIRRMRRDAELARRRSEERHRVLIEHSLDAVVVIDSSGTVSYVSPAFDEVFGPPAGEILGSGLEEWVMSDDREIVREALLRALASPREDIRVQLRAAHRDGSVRLLECILCNRVDTAAVHGIIVTARDVSQRWVVEAERRARTRAELASKTKSSFLANMSHELRTPLNAIIGFADLMEQGVAGPLSEKQATYVDNVLQAGRHLLGLVNDILDLSKIEAGKLDLCREWTALGSIARSVEHVFGPLALQRGVTLVVTVDDSLPDLYVDPLRLKQILLNLVSNAIKFTPRGGEVHVSACGNAKRIELHVKDTGIGIRAEHIPRLFREFEQLGVTIADDGRQTREVVEGTGLGLALTKRLVEMHGATILVESEFGKGSTFTVVFADIGRPAPVVDPIPPSNRRVFSMRPYPRGPGPILVVEDDPKAAALIAAHVRAAGVPVVFATGLEQTLLLAVHERPAAITLDIMMPNVDGWAILRCLKEEPSTAGIPVIIVSVDDDVARGRALGASFHLTKPVSCSSLHAALQSAGVPVRSIAGKRVLLVEEPGTDAVADVLNVAGCRLTRVQSPSSIPEPAFDVAVVDLRSGTSAPGTALERLPSSVPVIAIVASAPTVAPARHVSYVEWGGEEDAEELIRRIHDATSRELGPVTFSSQETS